jgi:acylphosphatase
MPTARFMVSGLVQGVGFRYFAARRAQEFGLTGYVKNLPSGDVEVMASGEKGMISDFAAALRVGPRGSRVSAVSVEWLETGETFEGFDIR